MFNIENFANLILWSLIILNISLAIILILLIWKKNKAIDSSLSEENHKEDYRNLFENANDAIFILDKNQNYLEVNKKAAELFGYSRKEFLKLNVKDLIPPDQFEKSDKEFERLGKNGQYEEFIGKARTKDGRVLDVEVNSSAVFNDGDFVGSRDIVRDITARMKAEEEKERLISELKRSVEEIKTLKGILPICSYCKKVRDDKGYWEQVEVYLREHSEADISHGICPECLKKHFPAKKNNQDE